MTIKPHNYNLTFEPDLEKFTFKGWEILDFDLPESAQEIVLDAADLKIVSCELLNANRNLVKNYRTVEKEEKLIIQLVQDLKQGRYKLRIEFTGILNDKLTGFYRSRYLVKGKEKILATSQFEATDARRAFPSIDNPSAKATFDVSLISDKNLTAISNTSVKKESEKNNQKIVSFATTPLMSTYLLYLGVGEFEWIEDSYKNIQIRVITTPGKKQYGKFAIECCKKSLEYFEKYFDYPYPLDKIDLLAIPEFSSGAMENWGAITFRENALLYYPDKSSQATKQRVAEVVAHELAHQWFGNLVTMKWWDDLWLNESFATYMAHKVLDHYWPEWNTWSQYITNTVFEGMGLDSLNSSHPIKVEVKSTAELEELFDEIAYDKGGSILRMLDLFLGEKEFRNGLRKYIRKYLYKNAQATDLWSVLGEASDKPILAVMESFMTQTGFPTISVGKTNNFLNLKQERFLFEGKDVKSIWKVPLVIKKGKDLIQNVYFPKKELDLEFSQENKLTTINSSFSGFYITDYSADLLDEISLKPENLNEAEKLGLIHDLFALILTGKKELAELYRCLDAFLLEEKSVVVLHYLIAKLTGIYLLINDQKAKDRASKLSSRSLEKIVGYEPSKQENIHDSFLRVLALSSLSLFDDPKVKKFIADKFKDYLKKESSLHPDLRGVIYSASVRQSEANYPIIKNLYRDSQIQEEKAKLLMALGYTKNKQLLSDTLQYALDKEVPFAFLPYAVASIARNPDAKEIALNWLIKMWPLLLERSGGLANMLLRRLLQFIVPICSFGREKEVTQFFTKNKTPGLERSIDQSLEMMRVNSRFIIRNKIKKTI